MPGKFNADTENERRTQFSSLSVRFNENVVIDEGIRFFKWSEWINVAYCEYVHNSSLRSNRPSMKILTKRRSRKLQMKKACFSWRSWFSFETLKPIKTWIELWNDCSYMKPS